MNATATQRIRVYLVDDEHLIRESLGSLLAEESGIDVVGDAGEAELALRELETIDVDVVLMDILLPGMDGIEATALLRTRRTDVAVVMLTSYKDEYVGAAIEAGATGYILKACTSKELIETVRAASEGTVSIDPALTAGLVNELAGLRRRYRESLLTSRQLGILKQIANGVRYQEVSASFFVSTSTVNREVRNIYDALGVSDAAHAVSEAHKLRLI
jgi:DNA-binding NarL/FixJ family response regulator